MKNYYTVVPEIEKLRKNPRMKKNYEEEVSSLVRGVKTISKRVEKGVGVDFTPDGLRKRKVKKHVMINNQEQYKQFESLKL